MFIKVTKRGDERCKFGDLIVAINTEDILFVEEDLKGAVIVLRNCDEPIFVREDIVDVIESLPTTVKNDYKRAKKGTFLEPNSSTLLNSKPEEESKLEVETRTEKCNGCFSEILVPNEYPKADAYYCSNKCEQKVRPNLDLGGFVYVGEGKQNG